MAISLAYGDSHSGKSKALERLAGHIFEQSGKKTRVYIGDGGGDTYNDRGLVDDGIIELFDFSHYDWPMTMLKLIADGWWPKDPLDPKSKLVAPAADEFDRYALKVYEGGTVIGQYLLSDIPGGLAWQAAKGTGFGGVKDEDDNLSVTDEAGYAGYTDHGANAPRHWQIVQAKLRAAVRSSKKFPGLVFWTAHPTEGPDKTAGGSSGQYGKVEGKKIIGPDFGGKAMASLIMKEFGDTLHFDIANIIKKDKDETTLKQISEVEREYRLYTRTHYDPNMQVLTEYMAGSRGGSKIKEYFKSITPGDSILQFYQAVKEAREAARSAR